VMLKIVRQGTGYTAQCVSFVAIYSAISARDSQIESVIGKALAKGGLMKVKSLRRDQHAPDETCVVHGNQVCLNLAPTAAMASK
jgi:hypothetical protein